MFIINRVGFFFAQDYIHCQISLKMTVDEMFIMLDREIEA